MSEGPLVVVDHLSRHFTLTESRPGFWGSVTGLFSRATSVRRAVDDISFSLEAGEFVGYVGENGAGKSTTIKMLTGILVPTSGTVRVGGLVPWESRRENSRQIGVVFGQRSQLWWDLPVRESFDLLRSIFRVPEGRFRENLAELDDALELSPLLATPVRKLSLGQRMRCDLAAAFLHDPKILFLDEPTIGLDLIAKDHVRSFLKRINQTRRTTIVLTTHDMDDIEALCERIVILDEGKIVYDGATESLKRRYVREKGVVVEFHGDPGVVTLPDLPTVRVEGEGAKRRFSVPVDSVGVATVIAAVAARFAVKDISIHEPKVGEVVKRIYDDPASLTRPEPGP
ncbi:MAG: ATP-binding cassette domain-containing protein [Nitrospinae bacterium]|nr:ATP-binding cassette domain-containing protein [Nitrospinota bacterium]